MTKEKTYPTSVSLPNDLKEWLHGFADAHHWSTSQSVVELIKFYQRLQKHTDLFKTAFMSDGVEEELLVPCGLTYHGDSEDFEVEAHAITDYGIADDVELEDFFEYESLTTDSGHPEIQLLFFIKELKRGVFGFELPRI